MSQYKFEGELVKHDSSFVEFNFTDKMQQQVE